MEAKIYKIMAEVEDTHWWFLGRRAAVEKLINKFVYKKEPLNILDAGCGSGGNFKYLSQYGSVVGLEPEMTAVDMAIKRGVAEKVVSGGFPVDKSQLNESSFDLVTMTDVLEHIEDDRNALKDVYSLMKQNGHLVLTVPAMQFLWSHHDVSHHHFRRYSASDLKLKLEAAGFKINYISYFNFWLFLPIAAVRLLKKKFKPNSTDEDIDTSKGIMNSIFKVIFKSETMFIGSIPFPFGVSVIACVTKE